MFIILGFIVIVIGTTIAIMRSKRPVGHILAEAKYELIYNTLGLKALVEDYVMRGKNKAGKTWLQSAYYIVLLSIAELHYFVARLSALQILAPFFGGMPQMFALILGAIIVFDEELYQYNTIIIAL